MSQRTENQVAEMKKQTIGVEVEMNSITREKAARLAATFFGTGRYENTACRNGYCTWSAWDESGREWKFQKDVSIAGPDSEKCEMVMPILTFVDMETLQELVRRLRKAGAKSDATRGCGVHIHIGAKGHTPQTLRNLANIMASHEDLLASALNLDRGRISRYCRTVDPRFLERLNNRKPTTMAALADIWYGSQNADYGRSQHYNDSRYHMLNLHATFTKGTVEFRLFQFDAPADGKQNGLHAGQLKSYIQLCLALSQMAKTVRTAAPSPSRTRTPNTQCALGSFASALLGTSSRPQESSSRSAWMGMQPSAAVEQPLEGRSPEAPEPPDGGLSVVEGNFGKEYFLWKNAITSLTAATSMSVRCGCAARRHGSSAHRFSRITNCFSRAAKQALTLRWK